MLSGNRELMDKLAAHLIEKETISGKEFMKIYRAEKGLPEPEENEEQEEKKVPKKDDFFAKKDDSFFTDTDASKKIERENERKEPEAKREPDRPEEKAENVKAPEKETNPESTPGSEEMPDGEKKPDPPVTGRFSNSPIDFN